MPSIKRIYFAALSIVMLLFAFGSYVNAQTLTVTNVTLPSGTPFNLTITGGFFGTSTRTVTAPYAGQIILQTQELGPIGTWCVDDLHTIYLGGHYTYTTGLLQTDSTGNTHGSSNPLSSGQIHDVLALAYYGNQLISTYAAGNARNIFSGQIQAAIWSVIYGATITGSGGPIGGFTAAQFNQGIANLIALAPSLPTGTAIALHNLAADGRILSQGLVTSFGKAVPAPGSLVLLAIGLVGFMAHRRKMA